MSFLYSIPLHGSADGPFLTAWDFTPPLTLALLLTGVGYWLALSRVRSSGYQIPAPWRVLAFHGGLLATAIALIGPFDTFNDALFLVHMTQHVLLMVVAAPLLLLGRPVQILLQALPSRVSKPVLRTILRRRWVRGTLTVITHPLMVFLLFNVNLILWHLPEFYVAALRSNLVHEIEHVAFFSTALLFWWVILDPVPRHHRLSSERSILLLFATGSVGDLLGLLLLLSPRVIYPYYAQVENPWGLSTVADQQIGGLIMLVCGSLVYFGSIFLIVARSMREPHTNTDMPVSRVQPPPVTDQVTEPV